MTNMQNRILQLLLNDRGIFEEAELLVYTINLTGQELKYYLNIRYALNI